MTGIWPFLAVKDVGVAVEFYVQAFGAVEQMAKFQAFSRFATSLAIRAIPE